MTLNLGEHTCQTILRFIRANGFIVMVIVVIVMMIMIDNDDRNRFVIFVIFNLISETHIFR